MKRPFTGDEPCTEVDVEFFFPEKNGWPQLKQIRAICEACWIQEECLEYAIEHEVRGFWGGTTDPERKRIIKERRRAARAA